MKRAVVALALLIPMAAMGGTISRGTKTATGTTAFGANSVLKSSELNTDFDTVYNLVNGNIEDVNVKSAADIALTKLGDTSVSATAHDADLTPGDYASRSLPTTLVGELQQLRYKLSQSAGVQPCTRTNGTGSQDVGWVELPAQGENLVTNAHFTVDSDADGIPQGWTAVGDGTGSVSAAATAEGFGNVWAVAGSDNAGASFTFDKLRASSRYAIFVRASVASGAADITTSGADATSEWRDVDVNLSGSTFADYCAVIKTDTTPTNVVVSILGDGSSWIGSIREFSVFELGAVRRPGKILNGVVVDADTTHTFVAGAGATATDASQVVSIPDINYYVKATVDGYCYQVTTGAGALLLELQEDGVTMGSQIAFGNAAGGSNVAETPLQFSITRTSISPTTATHTYRAVGTAGTRDWTCEAITLVVERIPIQ
jgi:hypothetical protein